MSKIRIIVKMEFDLDKFKKEFGERNYKKGRTWKDELKKIFEVNLDGFMEDLFSEYNIDEFNYNVEVVVDEK